MPLRIATLNVHGWRDAAFFDNVGRIAALIRDEALDAVGLQEVEQGPMSALAAQLGMVMSHSRYGCALLSRHPIVAQAPLPMRARRGRRTHTHRHRALHATLSVDGCLIRLVVAHLDHVQEPTRLAQLDAITHGLSGLPPLPTLWMGDFNALRADDYTRRQWAQLAQVRERNRWEAPHTTVTDRMRAAGLVDCWVAAGREGILSTCRFDTRIDYLWADPAFLRVWRLTRCRALASDASDHRMVVAAFSAS